MGNLKSQKGLTLVELLAVIVILGIIAAMAVPAIGKIINNSYNKAVKSEAIIVLEAAQLYFVDNELQYEWATANVTDLIKEGYIEGDGYLNSTSYVTNVTPAKICAYAEDKSKINFYNATAEEIVNSGNDINVGTDGCGDGNLKDGPH